jgi:hypothetical protein
MGTLPRSTSSDGVRTGTDPAQTSTVMLALGGLD